MNKVAPECNTRISGKCTVASASETFSAITRQLALFARPVNQPENVERNSVDVNLLATSSCWGTVNGFVYAIRNGK